MGFTPQQVNEMSIWQFMAAWDGYVEANDPEAGARMSEAEAEDVWRWMQGKD
ncbi:hypothetical protein [Mesorhizobium sp. IMUNJ 23232]|uniref:hypothetical protein n=1 Tax=Mesorhizobium sp. IMUNJ 23232 TaxID=3376064 RepID=UPI003792EF58